MLLDHCSFIICYYYFMAEVLCKFDTEQVKKFAEGPVHIKFVTIRFSHYSCTNIIPK